MSVLTQSERDGLDDVFLSINTGNKDFQLIKKLLFSALSRIKYVHILYVNTLHTLSRKIKTSK